MPDSVRVRASSRTRKRHTRGAAVPPPPPLPPQAPSQPPQGTAGSGDDGGTVQREQELMQVSMLVSLATDALDGDKEVNALHHYPRLQRTETLVAVGASRR